MEVVEHASHRRKALRAAAGPQSPKTSVGNLPTGVDDAASRARSIIASRNGAAKPGAQDANLLLCALSPREYADLVRHGERVTLAHGQTVYERGVPTSDVYFPQTAVFSMVREMKDGAGVEVGTIGRDGVAGASMLSGATSMSTRCIIQIPGCAHRLPVAALRTAAARSLVDGLEAEGGVNLGELLQRYAQALFEQVAQTAACNRLHSLEQRCARWLLMTHDRVDGDELALTQEFLSYMLGVRRAGVTEACGTLQRSGLIRYRHGHITVVDRPGLEVATCECYAVAAAAYTELVSAFIDGSLPSP